MRQTPLSAGIVLSDSAVEIDDMEIKGAGVGIEIRGAASPLLRANAIHDCTGEGVLILGLRGALALAQLAAGGIRERAWRRGRRQARRCWKTVFDRNKRGLPREPT